MTTIQARVIHAMTIPFTIQLASDSRDAAYLATCIDEITPQIDAFLRHVDATFSPFRADSQVAAARRGDWSAMLATSNTFSTQSGIRYAASTPYSRHASQAQTHYSQSESQSASQSESRPESRPESQSVPQSEFAQIYALAEQAKQLTRGHFNPMHAGQYDPTGIVKGWAIERAHERFLMPLITSGQCDAAALGGGGDIQTAVADTSDFVWRIGVQDPANPNATLRTITLRNGAVATSGTSKRGEHITRNAHDLAQATIVDDHLAFADMWATAAISAGERTFRDIVAQNPVAQASLHAVLVRADGSITQFAPGKTAPDAVPRTGA